MTSSHRAAEPFQPGFSLLRLSLGARVAGALGLSGALWLCVVWVLW